MKVDVSIMSFILVLIIAIPVTALRSQTYGVGYEIAELKSEERELRERNLTLKADLAKKQAELIANATEKDGLGLPPLDAISEIPELPKP